MDPVLERVCPVSFSLISFNFSQFISVSHSRSEFCSNQKSQKALEERNHKCVQRCIEKSAPGLRHRPEACDLIRIRFTQFWFVLSGNILYQY